jgi:hypothetical protein
MTNEDEDTMQPATPKVIDFARRRMQLLAGEYQPDRVDGLPEFISPSDISKLNDDQLDQLINLIRLRRLNSTLLYERSMRDKEQLTAGKAREQLEKKCVQVWKSIDKNFTDLEKLELLVNQMRALRIQAGLDW